MMKNTSVHLVSVTALLAMGACLSEAPGQSGGSEDDDQTSIAAAALATDCVSGRMCFWQNNGFAGDFLDLTADAENFENVEGVDFGDKTTSVWNRTSSTWVLYQHDTYRGNSVCLHAGASVANLGNFSFNDIVSSARAHGCPSGSIVFSGVN